MTRFFDLLQDENTTCIINKRNATVITNIYEGIPETIILNLIAWCVLLLLFAILRNRAWDYGRLALVHNENKWTNLFYKNTDDAIVAEESNNDCISLSADTGCSWFPAIFKINKQRLLLRCGPDAAHYLSFQEHLLLLALIITMFSLCVILPINFQGSLQGDVYTFGHTTLSNLEPHSKWLWVHVIASFCFVPLTVYIMSKCSGRNPSSTQLSSCTVMITHISRLHRNCEDIKNYFSVRYPSIVIKDVKIAYRIKKLTKIEKQRAIAHDAKDYCIKKPNTKVQPYGCVVCCPCKTVDALRYYTLEEQQLNELVTAERRRALENPLGIAFVTVENEEAARLIIDTFIPGTLRNWNITRAPSPSDIQWENLEISTRNWYSKAIIINVILFLVLFFLTTPAIVVNVFNSFTSAQENFIKKISPLLSEFLPTLLLLTMSALMPVIVAYSDECMSHWTKSKQNHATMHKTFTFLLFMVLILPSLGLTSAQAFVQWSIQSKNKTMYWECIFLPDKGALFVNYVITSAFIGTALELLRFPELAMYVYRLLLIRSEAEKISIRKEILSEFPFGVQYAWTLLIFTVCTVYSLTCPLIMPFCLIYLCLKHYVDKHNMYYVYRPISMCGDGQQIHAAAVRMARVAVFLLQAIITAFTILRGGFNVMAIIMLLGLISTCIFLFILSPFPSCHRKTYSVSNFNENKQDYTPPVLITSQINDNGSTTPPPIDYGSSNINDRIVENSNTSEA